MIRPVRRFSQYDVAMNGDSRLSGAAGEPGLPGLADALATQVPGGIDLSAAERAVRDLLLALGEDPRREGMQDTPRRVARAMAEMLSGRHLDPRETLARTFAHTSSGPVILRDIEFASLCEHHLLPFLGKAHVAYLPGEDRVVGLSKLARLVDVYAKRPQMQERMTQEIADALMEHLGAKGAAVIVEGEHMCMKIRGVAKRQPVMKTITLRGIYEMNPDLRREILGLLEG